MGLRCIQDVKAKVSGNSHLDLPSSQGEPVAADNKGLVSLAPLTAVLHHTVMLASLLSKVLGLSCISRMHSCCLPPGAARSAATSAKRAPAGRSQQQALQLRSK